MVTFEEAVKIAKEVKPNANTCTEWEHGYVFGSTDDEMYDGGHGHTTCVVHKDTGKVMTMPQFVISGAGEMLREFDI